MSCIICLQKIHSNFNILNCPCPYTYHAKCINTWLEKNRSCPHCRKTWVKNPFNEINMVQYGLPSRRNAIDPSTVTELQNRLFLESIGVNSSLYRTNPHPRPPPPSIQTSFENTYDAVMELFTPPTRHQSPYEFNIPIRNRL